MADSADGISSDRREDPTNEIDELRRELDETNRGVLALYEELDAHARKLAESDRRKDDFLALLAHELRNPLAIARFAVDELDPAPAVVVLRRQIEHLTRLVGDLLDVSRIARGKVALACAPLDLVELVDETIADREPVLRAMGNALVWLRPQESLVVEADAVRLAQVLDNLLHNAAKYSPADTAIRVSLERVDAEACLEVCDEGRGLTEDEQRRIFDLFVQSHEGGGAVSEGLGVGLTLALELTRMQGGRVEVTSEGRDRGSRFRVLLPLVDAPPARAAAPHPDDEARPGIRVLLVEDDDDLRLLLAHQLRRRGLEVDEALDGATVLERLESNSYDVVLSDLGLPDMSGFELAAEVRARHPQLPLVALSGYGAERDRRRSQAAGFVRHLVKPLSAGALVAALHEVLTPDPSS